MNNDTQSALALLPLIDRRHADDTSAWQSICIALKNCGVPYDAFEQWSLTDRHRDRKQIRRAWDNLRGGHTIGTLIHYAKLDGGNVSYVCACAKPGSFDGDRAFAAIIAPYADCSAIDLECELWERSPFRLEDECGEGDFLALLDALYDPDDLVFVGDPKVTADGQGQYIRSVREHLESPRPADALEAWLGPAADQIADMTALSDEELDRKLRGGAPVKFGDSGKFETAMTRDMEAAARNGSQVHR